MNDTYVECLVAQKPSTTTKLLKILAIVLAVVCFLASFVMGVFFLIGTIVFAAAGYFLMLNSAVEYEYLYCDKEVTIDKVLNKSSRKKMGSYEMERLEILAPYRSYHLNDFKNRKFTVKDYSIGTEEQPDKRYVMIYDGQMKLILSPSPEFVTAVRNVAPRKVFTD